MGLRSPTANFHATGFLQFQLTVLSAFSLGLLGKCGKCKKIKIEMRKYGEQIGENVPKTQKTQKESEKYREKLANLVKMLELQ